MASIDKVEFELTAKDETGQAISSAKRGLSDLRDTSQSVTERMAGHFESLKSNWLAATAAIAAAAVTVKEAWDLAEAAAGFEEAMGQLDGLAAKYGTTAADIVRVIQDMSEGMISRAGAASTAMSGIAKGLSPEMIYGLAKASTTLSDVMGTTAENAFKQMSEALEMNRQKTLKLAMGNIDLKESYGEAADKMSEAEKQVALYNLIMEKAAAISAQMGDGVSSTADDMERFKVTLADLRLELGQGLIRAGAGAVATFQTLASGALAATSAFYKLSAGYYSVKSAFGDAEAGRLANEYRDMARAANEASITLAGKAAANFGVMTASTDQLSRATATATAATQANANSMAKQEAEQKAAAAALKQTTAALTALIPVMANYGAEQQKLAQADYAAALKKEGATVQEMESSLTKYLATLKEVYDTRIEGEKRIAEAMKNIGASPAERMKADLEALKQEKEHMTQRLAAWQAYYDQLAQLHAKALTAQKQKEEELVKIQQDAQTQQANYRNQMLGLQEKLMVAEGRAASDQEIRAMKLKAIEEDRAQAMTLSGDAGVKALQAVQQKYGELTGAVTTASEKYDYAGRKWVTVNTEVQSSAESVKQAMANMASVQDQINLKVREAENAKRAEIEANKQWITDLETAMTKAKGEMESYKEKIVALSEAVANMEKDIAIAVKIDDQATATLQAIKAELDSIQNKSITVSVNQATGVPATTSTGAPSYYENLPKNTAVDVGGSTVMMDAGQAALYTEIGVGGGYGEGFAFGTRWVPETGMYMLHKGEQVIPKDQTSSQTIHFAPNISITGATKSAEQLAREIVRPLQAEMRRLAAVN